MRAYYLWTDIQLLNGLNLQLNQYSDQEADLYVLMLPRISERLVESIEQQSIFRNVFRLRPQKDLLKSDNQFLNAVNKIWLAIFRKSHFTKEFSKYTQGKNYSKLITAGFWEGTAYLFTQIIKNQPAARMDFVEEGTRHGDGLFSTTVSLMPLAKIIRYLQEGKFIRNFKNRVDWFWLYVPQRYADEKCNLYSCRELLPADQNNLRLLCCLCEYGKDIDVSEYKKRSLLFFFDAEFSTRYCDKIFNFTDLIEKAAEIAGADQIIVKMHPDEHNSPLSQIRKIPGVFYDDRKYCFEVLATKLSLDGKILVINRSSIMTSVLFMVRQNPAVLYVYRMTKEGSSPDYYMNSVTDAYRFFDAAPVHFTFPQNIESFQTCLQQYLKS